MDTTLPQPKYGLIGHRGLAGHAPENTLIGIQTAYEKGLNWVEFDVQLSKDHHMVIFHDENLNRTTNGDGLLYHHNYTDIKLLDAGSWYHPTYHDVEIPHLEQHLEKILQYPLQYNIEFKCPKRPTSSYNQILCETFCDLIIRKWPKERALPLVSSFDWDLLLSIRKKLNNIPVGFLCEKITPEIIRLAAKTQNATINCNHRSIDLADASRLQHLNIPLLAYTVNDPQIAQQLLTSGVFGIFTDELTEQNMLTKRAG